jgi:hypothetical protein
MKSSVFTFALFLLTFSAACSLSYAQKVSVIPLVPAANWRLAETQKLGLDALQSHGGDPAVEREYGVRGIEVRTYELDRSRAKVVLEPASDVSAAYGLFTYYQNESMHAQKSIQLAVTGPEVSLMARGRTFIRFLHPAGSHLGENDLRALLIFVGGTHATSDSLANLPTPLPSSGLIPGSEKYIIGPEVAGRLLPNLAATAIGFEQGAEVQIGAYTLGNSRATMMEVSYPNPQIARLRFGAMSAALGLNQDRPNALSARREGSFIFLALKADSKEMANKLLDRFNVSQQLSWDEKYPGDKTIGRQLFELVMGNVFLTLVLAGGGVLGGLLIVLSRRVTAKLFPELEWGHPEADRLIRLRLQ